MPTRRLPPRRVPTHHDEIGEPAAALGAAELQVLERTIALTGIDDGLQVGGPLVMAGRAPDKQASPVGLKRAARGRQAVSHRSLRAALSETPRQSAPMTARPMAITQAIHR